MGATRERAFARSHKLLRLAHKNGCARQKRNKNTLFSFLCLYLKISHQIVNVTRANYFS